MQWQTPAQVSQTITSQNNTTRKKKKKYGSALLCCVSGACMQSRKWTSLRHSDLQVGTSTVCHSESAVKLVGNQLLMCLLFQVFFAMQCLRLWLHPCARAVVAVRASHRLHCALVAATLTSASSEFSVRKRPHLDRVFLLLSWEAADLLPFPCRRLQQCCRGYFAILFFSFFSFLFFWTSIHNELIICRRCHICHRPPVMSAHTKPMKVKQLLWVY